MNNKLKYLLINWKMNKDSFGILDYFYTLEQSYHYKEQKWYYDLGISVPYPYLGLAKEKIKSSNLPIQIYGQDFHHETYGAFTSSVSVEQLIDFKVFGSLVGHSECRQYLHQNDQIINKKVLLGLSKNLKIVLCVGEDQEAYKNNESWNIIAKQITTALNNVVITQLSQLFIAYEPVWAIGTGLIPTKDIVFNITKKIKLLIKNLFGNNAEVKVLYGGSVVPNNFISFLELENVDGVLIGGAGLDAKKITQMLTTDIDE